jgi:hypothetical protein
VSTLYTTRFNNTNFTFCSQNVFMLSVFISKQTAIISIYSTDWLAFKPEAESVYCAVRAECYIHSGFFSALKESEKVLCFKEDRVQSRGSPYEICGQLRGVVRGYSPSNSVFPCHIILQVLQTYLHLNNILVRMSRGYCLVTFRISATIGQNISLTL